MSEERRRRLFRSPDRVPEEVDDEVRFHLERKTEALVARGMDRAEAEAEALRRFGNVDGVKQKMRTMSEDRRAAERTREGWDGLRQDLRFAVRQLVKNPVFTAVTVLTLALGIGMNTAIFSVVDGILFRPLPFPDSHELVNVWSDVTRRGGPDDEWLSYANFHSLTERSERLEALDAWGGWAPIWTDPDSPEQLLGAQVTHGMFSGVLGVEPALGRGFRAEDDAPGAPGVVLLSHGFWARAFGGDAGAIGRTLTLNDARFEVIGVMPEGFRPPFVPNAELWTVPGLDPLTLQDRRGNFSWRAVGRTTAGTSATAADAELREIGARLEAEYPESNTGMTFRAVGLRDDLTSAARTGLLVLLGAVAFVLLVACVNVANLLLSRASSRESELAVRSALGAQRGCLVRQLLTESVVLAAAGGAAGVAVAFGATDLLLSLAPDGTPRLDEVGVDGRVLAFTAGITLAAGLLFGLVPALRAAGSDLRGALREGARGGVARGSARLRSGLVVGQVALALVLLVGAGLLVRSFQNLRTADLGFEPADVVTVRVNLPGSRYGSAEERVVFVDQLMERLRALPGVESVGGTETVPLTGFDGDVGFHVEGRPPPEPGQEETAWFRAITPGYLETMGIELVQGRRFTEADREGDREVVLVNETVAARLFPGENPVGRRVTFSNPEDPDAFYREIVGVVRDIRNFGIREASRNAVYSPWAQTPRPVIFPVLATSVPPESVVPAVRAEVAELDPSLAVAQVRTMDEIVRAASAPDRFLATLLGLFAGVGLVLAVVGLYGVVSYGVSTRLREMGLRIALGAGGGDISGLVVRRSLTLVAGGLVLGVVGAAALTRVVGGLLFGVSATDPATFAAVALLLALAATAASLIPARRAARVDPIRVLRSE